MKQVFTNTEVAEVFAQRTQSFGRNSGYTFYFKNDKIYSYGSHYVVAEFIHNGAVLINDRGYSPTTGKHISLATNATRNYKQFFVSETNYSDVLRTLEQLHKQWLKARKKELYTAPAIKLFEKYIAYHNWAGTLNRDKVEELRKVLRKMNL